MYEKEIEAAKEHSSRMLELMNKGEITWEQCEPAIIRYQMWLTCEEIDNEILQELVALGKKE